MDQSIMVIECLSSGQMYIDEIIARGYKCIVVNPDVDDAHLTEQKEKIAIKYMSIYSSEQLVFYNTPYDCDAVVEVANKHNVICVVCGSEYGVRLTDQVAAALGLPGNNPATTDLRCTKTGMIRALNKAGVRAIKTAVVTTPEQVKDFWYSNNISKAFLKFAESAAGYATKKCETCIEAVEHFKYMKNLPNYFGNSSDDILIQEFIDGPEYVVNTISCQGKHILSDMWQYHKIQNDEGQILYQSSTLIHTLNDTQKDLLNYAMKVLNAENFEFGPCHSEFKIDQNGPILIETNPRPMGDSMSRDYMLDICGQCIVDWSLDSMINQEEFLKKIQANESYKMPLYSRKKYVIFNEDRNGDMASGFELVHHLKTFHNHNEYGPDGIKNYPKTHDLGDTPMILKLAGKDYSDVYYDSDAIKAVEKHFSELICCSKPDLPDGEKIAVENLPKICKEIAPDSGKCLVFHEEGKFVVQGDKVSKLNNNEEKFKTVIYANTAAGALANKFKEIFEMFNYLDLNGKSYIWPQAAEILPYKQEAFGVLKHIARLD